MKHTSDNQTLIPSIVGAIRDLIAQGTLREGEVIHQTELAQRLGVSSVPFREALRALEAQGLVTFLPYRGTIVSPVSPEEIRELHLAGRALELALLPHALPNLTPRDFQQLRELCAPLSGPEATPALLITWHQTLYRPAAMPRILHLLEGLVWRSARYFRAFQAVQADGNSRIPPRREVVEACESGDPARAQATLETFLVLHTEALLRAQANPESAAS